ncbi:MAG: SPFH domain-containing protein [Planctomycetes bacterium]|nr:SPFH domain-containing protein [Planctomycetota bacterium]MCB9904976.1 SPFH domain-containing protein [Planctomycetota bacterium]
MSVNKILYALLAIVVLGLLSASMLFERIEPGEIGVRQSLWGSGGLMKQDFTAGYHLGITGVHKWHVLDRRTHFLNFADESSQIETSRQHQNSQQMPALKIRTADNNVVTLDVTVVYRIQADKGHQIVADGAQTQYRDRVASQVQSVLREELSKLTPEDFQETEKRLASVEATLPVLAASIEEYHVEPERILIRAVRFLPSYEDKLQQKQLAQQQERLATAQRHVEDAEKVTFSIEKETEALEKEKTAEWDKDLQEMRSVNEVAINEIRAAAVRYENQVKPEADKNYDVALAEGKLAIDRAEALRDELRNAALDTAGGRILQARDAAENLQFESVTLNSNDPSVPNIIDIDALTKLLIGSDAPADSGD